jgi:hypothetical protein
VTLAKRDGFPQKSCFTLRVFYEAARSGETAILPGGKILILRLKCQLERSYGLKPYLGSYSPEKPMLNMPHPRISGISAMPNTSACIRAANAPQGARSSG